MGKSFSIKNIFTAPVIFITLLFLMPFFVQDAKAVEIPKGTNDQSEVIVVNKKTEYKKLTIGKNTVYKAPNGKLLTMTVDGTETDIAPGDYAGDIALTVTDKFKISGHKEAMSNWAGADFRTAVFLGKDGIIDSNSVLDAARGYQYSNGILTIADTVKSAGQKFNGIIVNAGRHKIKDVKIAFDGDGGNDYIGYGAGILVTGDATEATLDNVNIDTKGLVRTTLTVAGSAKVLVKNSHLIAHQGVLPKGYIPNAENVNGNMKAAPWTLGIDGTNRATNLLGYGTVTFFNSTVSSEGWGILSTDDSVAIKQNVINSTIKSDGSSVYGSFGIGSGSVINIFGSTYDVSGLLANIAGGILNIGSSSAENLAEVYGADIIKTDSKYDANVNSTLKSSRFGISASGNSIVNIKAGTIINSGLSSFISKGGNTTINVDGTTITANNGVILQIMDNDDAGADFANPAVPFRASYTEESGLPVKISGRDLTAQNHDYAGKKLDFPSMMQGKKLYINKSSGLDVTVNFSNMTLNGNIYNSTESFVNKKDIGVVSSASNLQVNLKNVQYKGGISSSRAEHIDVNSGKPIKTIANYKEVSYVRNTPREVINNGVNVALSGNSVWTVSGTSYLSSLIVDDGCSIKGTMKVNGVSTPITNGKMYTGNIVLSVIDEKAAEIPEGASFELMTDIGFKGSKFYLYSPSHSNLDFDMSRMLNSVVFVYPDKPYDTKEKAWEALAKTKLLDMAEKEVAYVIMPLPVAGDTWGQADLKLYYESQYYLAGGDVYTYPSMQYKRLVFNNLQYIIAEGNGSTFVNNILSQHAERIAGILTFGGNIDKPVKAGLALPAYLVNADKAAVSYYRAVNKADTEVKAGVFENGSYKLKKVIIAKGGNSFDSSIIADAWKKIFSRTARACVTDNVVLNNKVTSEWVLMERPNYKELGIRRVDHKKGELPDGTVTTWYDYVPNRVMSNLKIKVPLVITLHGMGDDPVYQADSNGWTAKAAEKGFIVISPDYPGSTAEGEKVVLNILDYAKKIYPIDESRVYLAGFSMGGATTAMIGLKNTDKFAAIAPMGATGYNDDALTAMVNSMKDKADLPFVMIVGAADSANVTTDEKGNKIVSGGGPFKGGLKLLMKINNLNTSNPDYTLYPYWGYPSYKPEVLTSKNLKYDVSYMSKEGSDKPIAKLVLFENAGHAHSDYYATLAWDFISMFSRSPAR